MSYTVEKGTGDIVIKGFEQGVADDPYAGISDIRNINLISIPKEGSVNFATSLNSNAAISSGTVTSSDATADTITISGASGFVSGNAIVFSAVTVGGLSTNTVYWLGGTYPTYFVYTDFQQTSLVNITSNSTGTFTVYNMAQPKHFTTDMIPAYWMQDSLGQVWSTSGGLGWRYTGNRAGTGTKSGNGMVYYQASDGTGYVFAFGDNKIDYVPIAANGAVGAWVYGWKPSDGTTANGAGYLKNNTVGVSHQVIVAPDNKVYYCDGNWIGRFFQSSPLTAFVPTSLTTYTPDNTAVLPFIDTANCLAPLGNTLLIGGSKNVIYPWDTFSQLAGYPILVAENNIQKMVTVNTNTYALVGNRGRIYITNGSQATLWKKIPDHISGTVEPYYAWGGLASSKNQIYFGASVTTNSGSAVTGYGGLWAIDVDTKALRLTNKLSYGTYLGYATAIIPNFATAPAGTGLYIGWDSGASTYGIDVTIGTPYTGGEATIDTDLIPIGTVLKPTTAGRVEFKLAVPLVAGESVKLQFRKSFSDNFADIDANVLFNTAGVYSGAYQSVNFENMQWIQIRAVLTSTASTPSYVRLTEVRLGS